MSASSAANGTDKDPRTGRFTPGNRARVSHGGRSPAVRAEKRQELAQCVRDQVLTRWAHLADQGPLLDLLVDTLADVAQLRTYVDEHGGPVGGRGRLLKPMEMLRAREHDVLAIADRLLLAPREIARLGAAAGLTPPAALMASAAQERLRAKVAAAQPSAAVNGHAGRLAASEVAE